MSDIVSTKDLPQEIRGALKRIGYRKRKAIVNIVDCVEIYGTNWSGGSRHEYTLFDETCRPLNRLFQGGDWMNPKPTTVTLVQGAPMVIEAGTFCGKAGTAFVFILPSFAMQLGMTQHTERGQSK